MNRPNTRFGRSLVQATSLSGVALLLCSPGAFAASHSFLVAAAAPAHALARPTADVTVAGRVTDSKGEGLPGVSIIVKGTSTGTTTDATGRFSLSVADGAVLQFSSVGFAKQEYTVNGATSAVAILLADDTQELNDVVVVGYGEQKKETLTGAVSTVGAKIFQDRGVVDNPISALQGQVPGVVVTRTSAAPGRAAWNFQVRGATSINPTQPLIVLDGVTLNNRDLLDTGFTVNNQDPLNSINPDDIESITFLKDAAAAIYGARAAGGVVLITTKKGKAGKMVVQYDGSASQKVIGLQPHLLDTKRYGQALSDAVANDYYGNTTLARTNSLWYRFGQLMLNQPVNSYIDLTLNNTTPINPSPGNHQLNPGFGDVKDLTFFDTNWVDVLWRNASSTSHNLSFSGRGEKAGFRVSLGYLYDGSLLAWGKNNNQRYNIRLAHDYQLSDKFKLETNIALERQDITQPSLVGAVLGQYQQPGFPVSTVDGKPYAWGTQYSPNWQAELGGENVESNSRIYANFRGTYEFTKNLRLVALAGYNWGLTNISERVNPIQWYNYAGNIAAPILAPSQAGSNLARTFNKDAYANLNAYLNYNKVFNEKHDVALTVGANYERDEYNGIYSRTNNIAAGDASGLNLGLSGDPSTRTNSESRNHYAIGSFFGRANYAFRQRYLFEAQGRYDGSSRFDANNRWSFFYGGSAGWRITEESFMQNVKFINELKPRISFGAVGNQSNISRYDYIQQLNINYSTGVTASGYPIIGATTAAQVSPTSTLVSLDRRWERVETTNFGLDYAVLDRRLTGSFDYFIKTNKDMLLNRVYPAVLGATAPFGNIGTLKTWGWEMALNWQDKIGEVGYRIGGSLTDSQNRLINKGGDNLIRQDFISSVEGYPLNSYFGLEYAGRIQTQAQLDAYRALAPGNTINMPLTTGTQPGVRLGDNMFKDLNGDGKLTSPEDLKYLGNNDPRYTFALNLGATWKGFDFAAILQGVGKRAILRANNWRVPFGSVFQGQTEFWYGNTWTPQNTEAYYPNLSAGQNGIGYNGYNYQLSDWAMENGAYVRLKNVVLGYTLPQSITKHIGASRVRFYYAGSDLWETSSIRDAWDPEATRDVGGFSRYPFFRLHTAGINVTF